MTTPRVARVSAFRHWVGRTLLSRSTRRHGRLYVWRRFLADRMERAARVGAAPGFATTTVADVAARTQGARVVELEPASSTPFPLPRVHTTRRWLLDVVPAPRAIEWPAMRVLDIPDGVVFGHDGAVGPDRDTVVTDLGFVYPITPRELFRRSDSSRQRGTVELPGATVSMLQLHPSNHAHALTQGVPRLDLIRRAIDLDTVDRVLVNASAAAVLRAAIARVGFDRDRVVEVPDDTPMFVCERLVVATAIPENSGTPPWGLALARELFVDRALPDGRPRRVFVERDSGDSRGVVNAVEVREALTARGFSLESMRDLSFEAQAAVFASADVIVGVHGAALANLVYARPGTRVVELVGANTFNWVFAPLSWSAGLRHDILVGVEPTPWRSCWTWQRDAEQRVNVQRLGFLLDRIVDPLEVGGRAASR